jgi:hypothetical protein
MQTEALDPTRSCKSEDYWPCDLALATQLSRFISCFRRRKIDIDLSKQVVKVIAVRQPQCSLIHDPLNECNFTTVQQQPRSIPTALWVILGINLSLVTTSYTDDFGAVVNPWCYRWWSMVADWSHCCNKYVKQVSTLKSVPDEPNFTITAYHIKITKTENCH